VESESAAESKYISDPLHHTQKGQNNPVLRTKQQIKQIAKHQNPAKDKKTQME